VMGSEYVVFNKPFTGYFIASIVTSVVVFGIIFIGVDFFGINGFTMGTITAISVFLICYVLLRMLKVRK